MQLHSVNSINHINYKNYVKGNSESLGKTDWGIRVKPGEGWVGFPVTLKCPAMTVVLDQFTDS